MPLEGLQGTSVPLDSSELFWGHCSPEERAIAGQHAEQTMRDCAVRQLTLGNPAQLVQ